MIFYSGASNNQLLQPSHPSISLAIPTTHCPSNPTNLLLLQPQTPFALHPWSPWPPPASAHSTLPAEPCHALTPNTNDPVSSNLTPTTLHQPSCLTPSIHSWPDPLLYIFTWPLHPHSPLHFSYLLPFGLFLLMPCPIAITHRLVCLNPTSLSLMQEHWSSWDSAISLMGFCNHLLKDLVGTLPKPLSFSPCQNHISCQYVGT